MSQLKDCIQAEVLVGYPEDLDVVSACGSDLVSDVLRFTKTRTVLLTGLTSKQMIRTAELLDLIAVIFVRGKRPSAELIEMGNELEIPLLCTKLPLFEACGRLYRDGLRGCSELRGGRGNAG